MWIRSNAVGEPAETVKIGTQDGGQVQLTYAEIRELRDKLQRVDWIFNDDLRQEQDVVHFSQGVSRQMWERGEKAVTRCGQTGSWYSDRQYVTCPECQRAERDEKEG